MDARTWPDALRIEADYGTGTFVRVIDDPLRPARRSPRIEESSSPTIKQHDSCQQQSRGAWLWDRVLP